MDELEFQFVRDDLQVVKEFELSSMGAAVNTVLHNKPALFKLSRKVNHYSASLTKAIEQIESIQLNTRMIQEFLQSMEKYHGFRNSNIESEDIFPLSDTVIKPQYLSQYIKMTAQLIDGAIKGTVSKEEIDKYLFGNVCEKVKRQTVNSNLSMNKLSAVDIALKKRTNYVMVDEDFIKDKVLNFVLKFKQYKSTILAEATAVSHALQEAESNFEGLLAALNDAKKDELSNEARAKMDYIAYNSLSGYLDVLGYVTMMTIRKLNEFAANVLTCERVYNDVVNWHGSDMVDESVHNATVMPLDTNSVSADLLEGRIGAFDALAKSLYDFHHTHPLYGMNYGNLRSTGDILHSVFDMEVDFTGYQKDVYDEIVKMFIEVKNGLDILAKNSDDYLMIFDDLRQKAGFTIPLDERFKERLMAIDDLSNYNDIPGHTNATMYRNMLAEVKEYPDNMDKIAKNAHETLITLNHVNDKFTNNINGEFKDAESLNELKMLTYTIRDELQKLAVIVSEKFMNRLQTLGGKLAAMNKVEEPMDPNKEAKPEIDLDHTDFRREVFKNEIDEFKESMMEEINALHHQYAVAKAKNLRGLNLVTEADATPTTNGGNEGNASTPADNGGSTKPTVTDNSTPEQNNNVSNDSTGGTKIVEIIQKFVNTFLTNLQRFSSKNTRWVLNNKQQLLNRGYENVTLNILPYTQMPYTKILPTIQQITMAVRAVHAVDLQSFADEQAAFNKVLSSVRGGVSSSGEVGSETQVINYFNTGSTNGAKVVAIANGDLQRFVASEMLPFCENYAGQFVRSLEKELNDLAKAVVEMYNKEAQNATPNDTKAKETAGQRAKGAKWVENAVKTVTKGVLNACKQRNNDYLKALSSLVPKTPVQPANQTQQGTGQEAQGQAAQNTAQTLQTQAQEPQVTQTQPTQ